MRITCLNVVVLLCVGCGRPESPSFPLAFHLAADEDHDADIVRHASRTADGEVRIGERLVAKWIPAHDTLTDFEPLVTRVNQDGNVELLVLLGPNDVSTKHMAAVRSIRDHHNMPRLSVSFTTEGAARMERLTGPNIGRHIAVAMDGRIVGTAQIRSTIADMAWVPGTLSQATIDNAVHRLTQHR